MPGSRRQLLLSGGAILLAVIVLSGCNTPPSGVDLNVPFRNQIGWDYCGAANVLMWRLYNGGNEISQSTIYNSMGGAGAGVSPEAIASGVAQYAFVPNAIVDREACDDGPYDKRDVIAARQIASVDEREPAVVIVDAGYHAVLINGGDWHEDSSTGLDVWDYTYVHDPDDRADVYKVAGDWVAWFTSGYTCEQVVDEYAVGNAGYYLETYGSSVSVRGYSGTRPGGDPIKY